MVRKNSSAEFFINSLKLSSPGCARTCLLSLLVLLNLGAVVDWRVFQVRIRLDCDPC